MVDVSQRDASVEILGRRQPLPVAVAPTAYHRLAHAEGEEATARGAAAAGCPYTLSTLATSRPAPVGEASPEGVKWFQVYVFRDRGVTRELVAEAEQAGFEALLLTVDLPVLGRRDREVGSGFTVGQASEVPGVHAAGGAGEISMQDTADLIDPSLTWDDARLAVEHGATGVVVSNHGGRQLDTVPAAAEVLPEVVEAIGEQATVMVDGGVRRGTDVAKALILGADCVLVGRPVLWGLATAGAEGVEAVLAMLADEFDRSLALLGVPRAADLRGRGDLIA
jgi:4-hydroxymandelate oxidase